MSPEFAPGESDDDVLAEITDRQETAMNPNRLIALDATDVDRVLVEIENLAGRRGWTDPAEAERDVAAALLNSIEHDSPGSLGEILERAGLDVVAVLRGYSPVRYEPEAAS